MPTSKWKDLAGLWIALAILGAVAAFAYGAFGAASDTLGRVEHTTEAQRQIDDAFAAYARSAAARRAYVVAGDASQLADPPALDRHLGDTLSELRATIADNPQQQARVDSLSMFVARRMADLDASVARRRLEGTEIETAVGLDLATKIRGVREEMQAEESRLLAERDAMTRRSLAFTRVAEVAGTLVSVLILLSAFRRLGREVAQRRKSESALSVSERFLDSIVENLPNMVFIKEAEELRFERINRAGEQLLGIERKDLIGKNDHDFFPRDQAEFFQKQDRETMDRGVVVDIPEEPIETNRGQRWLHTKKVPVGGEGGSARFLLGISEDITERRRAAAGLRAAKDAAVAANQELEAFSYAVAHDLRAPLRAMHGFAQALEEDYGASLEPGAKEYLARVRGAAVRMGELIDGLLDLARLSRSELARGKVDLSRLARLSLGVLREANPQRNVDVRVQDGLVAEGDESLLAVLLDNLLGNAWKFTSKRNEANIEVGSETKEGQVVFFVRDNGAGFEQAHASRLFGAFQRMHSTADFEGSGIGLATVQRIVRRHGGRVWAEGRVSHGATFYFSL